MRPIPTLVLAALMALPSVLPARTLIEAGSGRVSEAQNSAPAVSTRFRREFEAADLKPGERLVISLCVNDGSVVYLNGREIGRVNMPAGPVNATTLALAVADEKKKGLFVRLPVPPEAVREGARNVIEAEVHSANASGSQLTFDLTLKTLPVEEALPEPSAQAKEVLETFRKTSYLAPGTSIPDGYIDGGRHMKLDAQDRATSGREILLVDRAHDPELTRDLEFAKTLRGLPPLERARKLSLYVDSAMSPPGGAKLLTATVEQLEHEYVNKPLRIGDVRDQFHAGVCRHRSLLFKLLADEAGLRSALVRGNYVHLHAGGSGPHAWNEVQLDDGRRLLIDTTLRPKSDFPEITNPATTSAEIAKRYVKGDGTPYYLSAAK